MKRHIKKHYVAIALLVAAAAGVGLVAVLHASNTKLSDTTKESTNKEATQGEPFTETAPAPVTTLGCGWTC